MGRGATSSEYFSLQSALTDCDICLPFSLGMEAKNETFPVCKMKLVVFCIGNFTEFMAVAQNLLNCRD